jgi:hypothetical protein
VSRPKLRLSTLSSRRLGQNRPVIRPLCCLFPQRSVRAHRAPDQPPAPGRPPRARTPAHDLPRPAWGTGRGPPACIISSKGEVRRARRLKPRGVGRLSTQAEIERASANRRIAQPRSATATLIIERRSQHFPDPAREPLKTGRPRRAPTDYPVPHGDCSYIDKSDARAQLWLNRCISSSEAGASDHKD